MRAASALTESMGLPSGTGNGSNEPGLVSVEASSFVKPTKPTFIPRPRSKMCDFDHSAGVFPFASTTFAETYGKSASGISVLRR